MTIAIGKFVSETGTVPVTFVYAGVTHRRPVNACLTDKGAYDKAATAARVIATKVEAGPVRV